MSDDVAKPVLWVSLTSAGRSTMDSEAMGSLQERLEGELGDDYEVVVADDRVRLATVEDLQEMRAAINSLLPSDLETREEQQERRREEIGLSPEDVMGGGSDAPGVQEPNESEGEDEG